MIVSASITAICCAVLIHIGLTALPKYSYRCEDLPEILIAKGFIDSK